MLDRIISALSIVAATITVVFVVGVIAYNEVGKEETTVIVNLQDNADPFMAIPQIVPHTQASITRIESVDKDKNEYKIKVMSKQPKRRLLEMILGNDNVESAKVE